MTCGKIQESRRKQLWLINNKLGRYKTSVQQTLLLNWTWTWTWIWIWTQTWIWTRTWIWTEIGQWIVSETESETQTRIQSCTIYESLQYEIKMNMLHVCCLFHPLFQVKSVDCRKHSWQKHTVQKMTKCTGAEIKSGSFAPRNCSDKNTR